MIIENQYNSLINGNQEDLFIVFKELFKIENGNYTQFLDKFNIFHDSLQEQYFSFLISNILNVNNDFDFYNNLKNNGQIILNHINGINSFLEDKVFPYIVENFNIQDSFISLSYDNYNVFMIEKRNVMKQVLNNNSLPEYYNLIELINVFFNNLNDNLFFNQILKNNIFVNINNKTYLSPFFTRKLSLIFNINLNADIDNDIILFDDLYLNNFFLISMKVYDRFGFR